MSVSLHTTVYNWLKELKIPVSRIYIELQLFSPSDYPSLLSIYNIGFFVGDTVLEIGSKKKLFYIQTYLSGQLKQEMLRTWIIKSKSLKTKNFN